MVGVERMVVRGLTKNAEPVLPKPENFIRWKNIRVGKRKKYIKLCGYLIAISV
jgi:hypothetical protein